MSAEVAWISCCFVKKSEIAIVVVSNSIHHFNFFMSFAIRLSGRKAANKLID